MFLPDHRANRKTPRSRAAAARKAESFGAVSDQGCPVLADLADRMPGLFERPDRLFDVFASPALMFQTSGMDVPKSFTRSQELASQIDWLASVPAAPPSPDGEDSTHYKPPKPPAPPRRAALVFPPRASTLKIPETLLLYSRPPGLASSGKKLRRTKPWGNTFETQALEFGALMRRSVEKLEIKERRMWDEDFDDWEHLAERRVQLFETSPADDPAWGIGAGYAANVISGWLKDKCGY
ncbi:hypothetical protein jhhlp_003211 [Lomentospora prolificans]|uniref:Uncharacterized protein n=1 Tax=Lomentospora prolificans TaxID=41688 RepID=A0A2N3NGC2_9PEZI|nr:hypothetical protein jhhlp_003211 [Lomentospora prolificans]